MIIREIQDTDISDLFTVRVATDENNLTRDELTAMGITEESVQDKLQTSCKGWLCEKDNKKVGFSIGDWSTGEMWVIAVIPEYINQGIGSRLLKLVEDWLCENGCSELWLTTDIDVNLRAYSFYKKNGWVDKEIKEGVRYMIKKGTKSQV